MDAKAILTQIATREAELNPLYTRMNEDLDLYLLKDHVTNNLNGKKLNGIYNVTYDLPQTWADHAMTIMSPSFPTMHLSSNKLEDKELQIVYKWWGGLLYSANQRFKNIAQVPIHNYMTFQTCIRGWNIARAICWVKNRKVVWDITPCDALCVAWETSDQLEWISVRNDNMSAADARRRFGIYLGKGQKACKVIDYWGYDDNDRCFEMVFVDDKPFSTTYHPQIKRIPFIVQPVAITPMVSGSTVTGSTRSIGSINDITMLGESIFKGARDDFREMNDGMSFMKTQVVKDVKHPIVHESPNPKTQKLPEFPGEGGAVVEITPQEKIYDLPTRDNMATTSAYMAFVDAALQRRTTPNYDYGCMQFEMSAVAMDKVSRQITKVLAPRVKTLEVTYEGIFDLLLEQFIAGKFTDVLIDDKGNEFTVSAVDLNTVKGKFQVKFSVTGEEPEADSLVLQKVQMAKTAGWPERWIDEHISKFADIEKINEWRIEDDVRRFCPELSLTEAYQHTMAKAKVSKDKIEKETLLLKSALLEARIKQIINQETAGNQSNVQKVG